MREARIRWILFRRSHSLAPWQLLMLVALLVAGGISAAALSTYRSDQALGRQLVQLQSQAQALQSQVAAQRQEVAVAGSSQWQSELARADGLSGSGESVYVIESAVAAAGPGPAQAGVQKAAQVVSQMLAGVQAAP
ncbi:MAG: hypothetical protein WBU92_01170 [Candidatus Dormiibacterota bacterium]